MPMRQIIIAAPISADALLVLKHRGYQLYAHCEGIKEPVQIRNIARDKPAVQVCHWGYQWVPVAKIKKVVGMITEPDQRTAWSENVTKSIMPGGHK